MNLSGQHVDVPIPFPVHVGAFNMKANPQETLDVPVRDEYIASSVPLANIPYVRILRRNGVCQIDDLLVRLSVGLHPLLHRRALLHALAAEPAGCATNA